MAQKKVLVLGATGAMGKYLIPKLAERNYLVDAVALDACPFQHPNVNVITGNAKDHNFRDELLKNNYDAIVDFMIYATNELIPYLPRIIPATGHYIYLSSYRIYDGCEVPVKETSPRLLDHSNDIRLRNSDDYSIYKARGENVVHTFTNKNWTIIRPAITYSLMRYQLVTLEAFATVSRAKLGKTVVLPETAKNIQATMSWAGDIAEMIARLLFNEKAFGETFTVATAEHHTWGEIAEYYKDICNMKTVWVPQDDYLNIVTNDPRSTYAYYYWQLACDRLFNRIMDNSKVLAATGLKQDEMMKLYDGLKYEIGRCSDEELHRGKNFYININMDQYLREKGLN
ncbi:MAG: NAD(P)H-binding protein [Lentisphaeria bacterium]|nr:NAD(P)H-binding protein [Lentisphaeria bacterium]